MDTSAKAESAAAGRARGHHRKNTELKDRNSVIQNVSGQLIWVPLVASLW